MLTALVFLYPKLRNNPAPITTPGDTSNQSKSEIPIINKVNYPIDDLRCDLSEGKNPIDMGASKIALPNYSVDVKQHLLLDKDGKHVSSPEVTNLDKLESARLIVVHTSPQALGIDTSHFAHVWISRDGTVKQLVSLNYATKHASNSKWKGLNDVNKYSVSIELENSGPLQYQINGWYSWVGESVPDDEVIRLKGDLKWRGWHKFTGEQIRAFFEVACALRRAYPTIVEIVGHTEIDPSVGDPGPLFPMEEMHIKLFPQKRLRNR